MNDFQIKRVKLSQLFDKIVATEQTIAALDATPITHSTNNALEKFTTNDITHAYTLYDLYKFLGVTFTNTESEAQPPEYYTQSESGNSWSFNLPVFGYRVPQGVDPATLLGVGPWEYQATVVIVKTRIVYLELPDEYIKKAKVISYLYNDANVTMPSFVLMIDPIQELSTDYSYFYRWIKTTDGYNLDYYAFWLWSPDVDVKLKTNVYFLNKDLGNEIQSNIL